MEIGISQSRPKCSSSKMVLAVELVGFLVVVGVGGDVHPGPGVEHLEPVAVGVGQQRRRDVVQVLDQGVISGISITLG